MPLIPETWLDSQIANVTTSGAESDPDITQLANGNIVVSWVSTHVTGDGSPAGTEIFGRIYDPLGNPVTGEIRLNQVSTADNERNPDLVALADGGFLVIYHDSNISGAGNGNLRLEAYDATGLALPETSLIVNDNASSAFPNYANPRGAASGATSVLVVFDEITSAATTNIEGRVYNPVTQTYGAVFTLISGARTNTADVVALSNGNYAVVANRDDTDDSIVYTVRNAAGGVVQGASFVAGTNTNGASDAEASVAALAGGGFVVVWANTGGDTDLSFRIYSNAGVETFAGSINAVGITQNNNEPVVTGLADGSFIVAYDNDEFDLQQVAHVSAAGAVLGTFSYEGTGNQPAIVALEDGRFAISWVNGVTGNIEMEILDTRDAENDPPVYDGNWQIGTVGADVFTTDTGADQIAGHDGNDTITEGTTGNQTIDGGAGDDIIRVVTLIGSDAWHGGAGADTIDWSGVLNEDGATFDLALELAVDSGGSDEVMTSFINLIGTGQNDTIIGGVANNSLSGGAGNDAISGGGAGDQLFGGLGNDTLNGDSGSDTLFGGDGVDRLDGGTAGDTMEGGLGNDRYIVDDLADVIQNEIGFSLGGGIDTVESSVDFTLTSGLEVLRLQGGADLSGFGNAAPENIVGNTGANIIGGGGGNDNLNGKAGDDTITGGNGSDTIVGDTGADTFVYTAAPQSGVGQGVRDFLNGFTHGQDRIDLSVIDANSIGGGANDAFSFIGSAAFTGSGAASAGQLRFFTFGGGNFNIVEADRNGDGAADMQIFINLTATMTALDFIL